MLSELVRGMQQLCENKEGRECEQHFTLPTEIFFLDDEIQLRLKEGNFI